MLDASRGFSIVELIVAVAIVVLLVALVAPGLQGVRRSAIDARTNALLGSHAQVMSMYAADWQDSWPYVVNPRATLTVVRCNGEGIAVAGRYFEHSSSWHVALADGYYGGRIDQHQFIAPGVPAHAWSLDLRGMTSFTYGCVFITHPDYWREETRLEPPAQWQATRMADVLFASKKAILTSMFTWMEDTAAASAHMEASYNSAFADGRAAVVPPSDRLPRQSPGDDGPYPEAGAHVGPYPVMAHTREGVRGRDVR